MREITINTDVEKLNLKLIHNFISKSYWGKGRTIEQIEKSIKQSLNFGIYADGKQIGYARVVTDFTFFAYLMDVFIVENERGKGYSKNLMEYIMNYPSLKNVENWKLTTVDAHKLYEKYGFHKIENADKMMERKLKNTLNKNVQPTITADLPASTNL